jgi:hypothetical protein
VIVKRWFPVMPGIVAAERLHREVNSQGRRDRIDCDAEKKETGVVVLK